MTSGTRRISPPHSRTGEHDVVDVGPVEFQLRRNGTGRQLPELLDRTDAVRVPLLAAPDGQGRAPVAVAAERPVDVAGEPLAEAPVLDVLRVPGDVVVGGDELVLDRRGADVPGGLAVVEQRRVAAPAERIAVLVGLDAQQQAAVLELVRDGRVRVLDPDAGPRRDLGDELALEVDGVHHRQVVVHAHAHVGLAERGRDVHDAGAVRGRDVVVADDEVCALVGLHVVEQRLVVQAAEVGPGELAQDLGLLAEHGLDQVAREHEALAAALDERVGDVRAHRGGHVADERPRRGGPDGERDALGLAVPLPAVHALRHLGRRLRREREAHVDGVLGDVLVALRHLVAADGRAAARAVRHHLEALVEQALVPDGAQQPPHRLDVVVGVGVVRVVQVDPEPDALREPLPLREVGGHALLAERVELGDAVGLDLLLAVDAQAALDLELHRQPVRVPARLAGDAVAAHGLVAREEVLEDARDDVVRARPAVGGGRPLVEDEDRRVLAALEALVEDVVGLPELEDARVQRREVDARRDVLEPGLTVSHGTRFLLHLAGTAILPDTQREPRSDAGAREARGAPTLWSTWEGRAARDICPVRTRVIRRTSKHPMGCPDVRPEARRANGYRMD